MRLGKGPDSLLHPYRSLPHSEAGMPRMTMSSLVTDIQ
jgi:hypothetical protein